MLLTIDQIHARLQDRRPSLVAKETGLHNNTVRAIRDNPNANPTYRAIEALSKYLNERA